MKPVFALSLSFEGITLLVRAAGGWRRIGSVPPEDADFLDKIARIKADAIALDRGPLRCKVVIPDDQIRYMTIETGAQSYYDRRAAARLALDGATPYAVEDLAYDICEDGPRTHVAAVARETLAEAEGFCLDHGLEPLCFVASPGDAGFLGEPFFATARHAETVLDKGEEVETDGIAVVDLGPLEAAPPPASEPAPPPEPEPEPEITPNFVSRRKPDTASDGAAPQEAREKPRLSASAPAQSLVQSLKATKAGKPKVDAPRPDAAEKVKFPEKLGGAPPPPPRRKPGEKPALEALAARKPVEDNPDTAPAPEAKAPIIDRDALAREMARKGAELTAKAAKAIAARPKDAAASQAAPSPRKQEAERLTVFGARAADKPQAVGGKPRALGMILTVVLLIFIAGVAAWSALFMEDGLGRFFRSDAELVSVPDQPAPVLAPVAQPEALAQPGAIRPQSRPEVVADEGIADAALADAETVETVAAAPESAAETETETATGPEPDTETAAVDEPPAAPAPALNTAEPEQPPEPAPQVAEAPPEPVIDPLRAPASGAPMTQEQAQARYAVTGIWPRAPQEPQTPGVIELDDFYIASIDPATTMQDALALPVPQASDHDRPLNAQPLPPAPGSSFDLGSDGRVTPSPEGTLSPEGFLVYLGRPPVVPPPTPERATPEPATTEAPAPTTPRIRPRQRPGDLIEETERTQFGGRTRTELASLRPRLRPGGAQAQAAVQPLVPGVDTNDATAEAIIASLAPRPRPGNISSLVEDANPTPASLGSTAGALIAPRPAPSTSSAPSLPSSASVARQATVKNAINLRQVNLIGVYGTPSARRALVRLPSGRYRKVQVGDRIDGGQVVAIGDSELRYQKGSRNLTLKIPSS